MLRRCLCLLVLTLWAGAGACAQAPREPADIRLLVDISGSMARTDPENLRRPALSLLVRLLPPDSRAGVWTFGSEVNALVPHGDVDDPWKDRALTAVDDIGSPALYTHIGAALEAAAYDRETLSGTRDRADIILLTDGMVDVSPDPAVSAREQRWLIDSLVPELRAVGYRIHTIGLSDEADEPLLRQIARQSDGMFSRARNAEQLMDSLLQIFQQTVPAEQLPINDGLFLIDDSVQEFTALVRRDPEQPPTVLTDPRGRRYQAESLAAGMNWHHTGDYDLITVKEPLPGRWEINATLKPYSRLTVISNLKLAVEPLPNNIHVGEPIHTRFHLRSDEGVVQNPDLLSVVDAVADIRGPDGDVLARKRWSAEPPADGRYALTLQAPERPGEHELRLTLDGKSFQRLYTHRWAVASQFEVNLAKRIEEERVIWRLEVDGKDTVNPAQTNVVAHIRHSRGYSAVETLEAKSPGLWTYELTPLEPANYRISLKASGRTDDGRPFEEHLPSQYFSYPQADDPRADPTGDAIQEEQGALEAQQSETEQARSGAATQAPESSTVLGESAEPAPPPPEKPAAQPRKGTHPAVLVGSLVLANGLLLVLAYFGYRHIVGTRPDDDTPEDVAEEPTEQPSEPPPMQSIDTDLEAQLAPKAEQKPTSQPEEGVDLADDEGEPLFPLPDDEDEDDPNR